MVSLKQARFYTEHLARHTKRTRALVAGGNVFGIAERVLFVNFCPLFQGANFFWGRVK